MSAKNSFVIVSDRDDHIRWLQSALADSGDLVVADVDNLERILQIIDVTGALLVFVEINKEQLSHQISIIEGLLTVKPLISIVAMSKSSVSDLVLAVMRAGARDFIVPGEDRGQVKSVVKRLAEHVPQSHQRRKFSKMVVLANARPDSDTVLLAMHLALAAQELDQDQKTLLMDLGIPSGDALLYLGIKSSYSFVDAIRSLRRLDQTLIESAFAKHPCGLRILDMGSDRADMHDITSADIFVLLGTLRTYFPNIVVNLGGLPASEFLEVLLRHADQVIIVAEQSVPSVQQNMALIKRATAQRLEVDRMGLVVDRYYSKLVPGADVIAKGFGLPLLTTLPPCGLARLNVINSGLSMYETAPKEQYCEQVRGLAQKIFGEKAEERETIRQQGLGAYLRGLRKIFISEV